MTVWARWKTWARWGEPASGPSLPTDIPAAEAEALIWLYDNLDGANWTENTGWKSAPLAANWAGVTVAGGKVTAISLYSYWDNGLNGNISSFAIDAFAGLLEFTIGGNALVTGDISGWSLPATLQQFNMYSTGVSGDVSALQIPPSATHWALDNTSVTGSVAAMAIPATLVQFVVYGTALTGSPIWTNAAALTQVRADGCSLSQADVDAYVAGIYGRRASITGATPDLKIGGSNATPSGIYQDGDPPTTGQEYIYELENDPETEGFTVWTISYTVSWAIQGTINDSAGAALSGVLVTLSGDASDTDTTGAGGTYSFPNLADGSYVVTPTKGGSTFAPVSDAVAVSGSNEVATTMAQAWAITGDIVDWADAGIEGVLVTLSGDASDTDTTDADGAYSFPGLADGSYTATPTKADYLFDPASRAAAVSGADAAVTDIAGWTLVYPLIENFELDTVTEDAAALEAKLTHYDVYGAGVTCQLDDYSTIPAIANGNTLTQCVTDIGTNYCGQAMLVAAGKGFVPSDGAILVAEVVVYTIGTGAKANFWMRDAASQEGIFVGFEGGNFFLDTITGGSGTRKINQASGLSSSPDGICWFLFGLRYNLASLATYFRIKEFGSTGATQEDTGWVAGGTVSSPTYDDTEWTLFQGAANSNTASLQGVAQLRINNVEVYGNGAKETANYRIPTQS